MQVLTLLMPYSILVCPGAECYNMLFACSTLCDPYLNLFRGIIPPLNGTIDLSPILAFIALDVSFLSCLCCLLGCRAWHVAQGMSSCTFSYPLQLHPLSCTSWHSCKLSNKVTKVVIVPLRYMHVLAFQVLNLLKVTNIHACIGCIGVQQLLTSLPVTPHEAASHAGVSLLHASA